MPKHCLQEPNASAELLHFWDLVGAGLSDDAPAYDMEDWDSYLFGSESDHP